MYKTASFAEFNNLSIASVGVLHQQYFQKKYHCWSKDTTTANAINKIYLWQLD